jgi:electron transport complex protein RnfE
MKSLQILFNGIVKENPIFVMLLGMCPTLATTSSAMNGMGMGLATTAVLVLTNMALSAVAPQIPDKVRIPVYIVIIAALVSVVELLMRAYTNELYEALGVFIPLIAVNCIVFARVEAFACKNSVFNSLLDGLGMGLGFTLALTIIGSVRELLGAGAIFGHQLFSDGVIVFILAPGAFIALAYLIVIFNKLKKR